MNTAYQAIIAASDDDRRGLFNSTAVRIGTTIQNIEKDFWVCWVLDALFQRLKPGGPRLLFKGGTSLSKGYGLISRFSEDVDITVFRADIGAKTTYEELEALSKKKRSARLDEIKAACQAYIKDTLRPELEAIAKKSMESASKDRAMLRVELDDADADAQSLLVHYPSVADKSDYVTPTVKIEGGAKSALDPNEIKVIIPYLTPDFAGSGSLNVSNVTTIQPERTLLDKILIVHGMTFFYDAKGKLRGNGRMSRHYYDVHQLMNAPVGAQACKDDVLIEDCVRHARMFFYRNDTGLDKAHRGSFRLRPTGEMLAPLRDDYKAMSTMIFGEVPSFDAVLASIARAEELLNAPLQ